MPSTLSTEQQLRAIIKAPPGTVTAKILSGPLRAAATGFAAAARLGIATVHSPLARPRSFLFGGEPGVVEQDNATGSLVLPVPTAWPVDLANLDRADVGLLLMIPGVRHTLRVNGRLARTDDEKLEITPTQSYAHCAKAFIRSGLWSPEAGAVGVSETTDQQRKQPGVLTDEVARFIASSPFATIGTSSEAGADVSPRGDGAGFVQVLDNDMLFIPERPGNRIADSLRNLIANPAISLLFVRPNDGQLLEIAGEAVVSTEAARLAAAEVNGKVPKLGILVTANWASLREEPGLASSGAWDAAGHASEADLPTIGALVMDPKGDGTLVKRALAGVTDRAVDRDYRRNLY